MTVRWGFVGYGRAALLGAVALVVGACSATETTLPPPCPEILIPVDAAKLTRFQPGPGRDIVDVVHEEQVAGFADRCEYDTDATGAGHVMVEIFPAFDSTRGPANQASQADFEYFIAIASVDKKVLEKKRVPVSIDFPENMSRVQWQQEKPITLTIPLKAGQSGRDFQIFLGLQMTRDELEFQRKMR